MVIFNSYVKLPEGIWKHKVDLPHPPYPAIQKTKQKTNATRRTHFFSAVTSILSQLRFLPCLRAIDGTKGCSRAIFLLYWGIYILYQYKYKYIYIDIHMYVYIYIFNVGHS